MKTFKEFFDDLNTFGQTVEIILGSLIVAIILSLIHIAITDPPSKPSTVSTKGKLKEYCIYMLSV